MKKMLQPNRKPIHSKLVSKPRASLWISTCLLVYGGAVMTAQASAVQWLESPHAGVDQNRDGVRDDVAESLKANYGKAPQRHWAMEIARAGQRFVTSDGNPFAIYRAQAEMQRAMRCLGKAEDETRAAVIRDDVLGLLLNTEGRQHAYSSAVAQWEADVRFRELPSQPDDRWDATCGVYGQARSKPRPAPAVAVKVASARSAARPKQNTAGLMPAVVRVSELPPPNFFLTGNIPKVAPVRVADASESTGDQLPSWAQVPAPGEKTGDKPATQMTLPPSVVVEPPSAAKKSQPVEYKQEAGPAPVPEMAPAERVPATTTVTEERPVLEPADMSVEPPEAVVETAPAVVPVEPAEATVLESQPIPESVEVVSEPVPLAPQEETAGKWVEEVPPVAPDTEAASESAEAQPEQAGPLPTELKALAPYIKSYRINQPWNAEE